MRPRWATSQSGAPVVGSAITTAEAVELGVPKAQTITVAANETLRYGDIAIRPTHIIHSTIEDGLILETVPEDRRTAILLAFPGRSPRGMSLHCHWGHPV